MERRTLALLLALALFLTACTAPPAGSTPPDTTSASIETTAPPETTAPVELIRYPLNADSTYANLAQELPAHIYTTTGAENGLGGTVYKFTGTVTEYSTTPMEVSSVEQIFVETEGGQVMVANFYKWLYNSACIEFGETLANAAYPYSVADYQLPAVGETAEFIAIYTGYSGAVNMPMFYLGANPALFELEDYPDPAKQPEDPTEPGSTAVPTEAITKGQKNALAQAHSYLDFSAFSYIGLIDQLEYEGYTREEATYAADNCGANWMEQALKNAESYLSFSAFSYSGLIDQLEYEGYTKEECTYAADNCGADWMEQAVKCAESYLSFSSFSRSKLIDQLEYEGFTHEQAVYGAEQNGY